MKQTVFSLLAILIATATLLIVLELFSWGLYRLEIAPSCDIDCGRLSAFPMSFRLSPKDLTDLLHGCRLEDFVGEIDESVVCSVDDSGQKKIRFVVENPDDISDRHEISALEFYVGPTVHRVRNPFSENAVNLANLKSKPSRRYLSEDVYLAALKRELENGRKLVVAVGGSTTAWSFNWPYFLSTKLEEKSPGRWVVLNAGQPGFTMFEQAYLLEKAILPSLDQHSIRINRIIGLHGFNELETGFWFFLESISKPGSTSAPELIPDRLFSKDLIKKQKKAVAKIAPGFIRSLAWIAPHTSFLLHRTLTKKKKDPAPTGKVDTASSNPKIESAVSRLALNHSKDRIELSRDQVSSISKFFGSTLDQLREVARSKQIPITHYLQPILLPSFYSNMDARKEIWNASKGPYAPDVDYFFSLYGFRGIKIPYLTDFRRVYDEFAIVLENERKSGNCCFRNIATSFSDIPVSTTSNNAGDLYSGDAVHYSPRGAEAIASRIFSDFD